MGRPVGCVNLTQGAKRQLEEHLDFSYVQEDFEVCGENCLGGVNR